MNKEEEEVEYQCPHCETWFNTSYIYCPICGEYTTCSGMIRERTKNTND